MSKYKDDKRITFIFVPQKTSSTYQFHISKRLAKYFLLVGIVFLLVTIYSVTNYVRYSKNDLAYQELAIDKDIQKAETRKFILSHEKYMDNLLQLADYDKKLRSIMNVNQSSDTPPASQIGDVFYNNSSNLREKDFLPGNLLDYPIDVLLEHLNDIQASNIKHLTIRKESISQLQSYLLQAKDKLISTPSIKPVNVGYLTSKYGMRSDPFLGIKKMHYGIDWASLPFTPIYSVANGRVAKVFYSISSGNVVVIDHSNGIQTLYAHLAKSEVKVGQRVSRGSIIARMGNTGKRSTATHLHYEVLVNGENVDPASYILEELPEVTSQFTVEF